MDIMEIWTGAKWAAVDKDTNGNLAYEYSGERVGSGLHHIRVTDISAAPMPYVQGVGDFVASSLPVTASWPAHAAGDLGLLLTVTRSDQNDFTDYAGWTDLNVPNVAGSGFREIRALTRIAANDHMGDVAMDDSGQMNGAVIITVRDAASARLIDWDHGTGDGNTVAFPSGETAGDNRLVLIAVALGGDVSVSQLDAIANEGLTNLVTHLESHVTVASGFGLYVFAAQRQYAGKILSTIMTTIGTAAAYRAIVIECAP